MMCSTEKCSASKHVPELVYFNVRGKAEVIRHMYIISGAEFKDTRFADFEEWKTIKAEGKINLPFGQVPVLRITPEVSICQSGAIEYFVAKKLGFLGDNLCQETMNIMVSHCVDDVLSAFNGVYHLKEDEKKAVIDKYVEEKVDDYLLKLTNLLKKNSAKSELFVGDKVGLADLRVFKVLECFESYGIKVDEAKYPELLKLEKRILSDANLKKYLETRPKTSI